MVIGTAPLENIATSPSYATTYQSPYLDIASTRTPKEIKELFQLAEYNAMSNSLVAACLFKKSSYPVTSIIYDDEDKGLVSRWKHIIEDILGFPETLTTMNLNFNTYGNLLCSVRFPMKKEMTCGICNEKSDFLNIPTYEIQDTSLVMGVCPKCGALNPPTEVKDIYINDVEKIQLIVWNPNNIGIKLNSYTGDRRIEYSIPDEDRTAIKTKKISKLELNHTDQIYIAAALSKDNKVVVFDNNTIFHMKAPSLAGVDQAWGYPQLLAMTKDLYYFQLFKKANEAILHGHMVPYRYVFPVSPPDAQIPFGGLDLVAWRSFMRQELARFTRDTNYISIFPFQVGQGEFGGKGRALLTMAEMNEMAKYVLAGLGVPQEFIYGGLSWSGSNVSLRMLENEFLTVRKNNLKVLEFIIDKISNQMNIPKIKIHLAEFKMADDTQRKQFLVNLSAGGAQTPKVSNDTVLDEFGLDWEKEADKIKKEQELYSKLYDKIAKDSAITGAEAGMEQQKIQMDFQTKMQEKQNKQMQLQQQQQMGTQQPTAQGGAINPNTAPQAENQRQQQEAITTKQEGKQVVTPTQSPEVKPPKGKNKQI